MKMWLVFLLLGTTAVVASGSDTSTTAKQSCGFILSKDQGANVRCNVPTQHTCKEESELVSFCPSECPFVDRSQYFPCLAKCVKDDGCKAGLKGVEFPNPNAKVCEICQVLGCVRCSADNGKCA
ncbi:unnamed protein product, partial [Amoebophrya sp. A25]|eukprot:GSA25T00026410001.1